MLCQAVTLILDLLTLNFYSTSVVMHLSNLLNNKGPDASYKLLKHSIRVKPTSITCIHC